VYDKLEGYFKGLINQFPKDSLFYIEKIIFNPSYKATGDNKEKFADGEAGTIDLLVLEPMDGKWKANIFDWKFMGKNDSYDDIASYKQGAYDIQLGTYKTTLKKDYGVESFGSVRAIPIIMDVTYSPSPRLKGIAIGSANVRDIEELKLLLYPSSLKELV